MDCINHKKTVAQNNVVCLDCDKYLMSAKDYIEKLEDKLRIWNECLNKISEGVAGCDAQWMAQEALKIE